jgi:hypothetical protein
MTCKPEGGCWCTELPHCVPMPASEGEGCLCRKCLLAKMESLRKVHQRQNRDAKPLRRVD